MLEELKRRVSAANRDLVKTGLVTLTWGNASGIDRRQGLVVIKPSGVPYDELQPECMVVVDLEGRVVEGDAETLQRHADPSRSCIARFQTIGGVVHTHSRHATMFAQARREIPCLGTTHADHFHGPVPVTRPLSEQEVAEDYEGSYRPGDRRALRRSRSRRHARRIGRRPRAVHLGQSAEKALENSVALEAVAEMALGTWSIDRAAPELEPWVLEKHYQRKHGPAAYYGQK